ncbi:MAG: protoheme IX farnesyltransferase [Rhodospirillales bacterium]|jgi:heme o synthase|nr:protoheme IX farnesyltransferase [Rhodospirillales bacterium]MBT4040152.1 protoheme IX farnesyltransferase [Rhodospirillales bacterium]MBT4625754.1 protoheme IX farnesyltransferase [Rhodospirillales bacterium]MBT5352648.1 protoheme IX farnesyltransferase [Rhodospirillales bacterium]MBT5521716.1 protoheme IX farnesyltransferase [Rhodospirillales bacterium]
MTDATETPADTTQQDTAENVETPEARGPRYRLVEYALILKPRVMSLVVFTGWVGLMMAPGAIDFVPALIAVLCIAVGAGASGAINMWYDRDIDLIMARTANRPIPAGRLEPWEALSFGIFLSAGSVIIMAEWVNQAAAILLALTILYYVFIYTVWLKRRTPQNIVIGGASGALPPVIGWAAVTGDVGLGAIVLFLIIFLWTPPHTWALALFRRGDYENAGIPMLPVVAGERETRKQILFYTVLMVASTAAPVIIGMSGWLYAFGTFALGVEFLRRAWRMWKQADEAAARPLFLFSIFYLFMIFLLLLADKGLMAFLAN